MSGHSVDLERENQVKDIHTSVHTYNDDERAVIAEFAAAEDAAHNAAYRLALKWQPGETIDLVDEDGEIRKYNVTPIETQNPAIVGFILSGIEPENNRIHVVFRGTADKASMVRDLEYGGAGQETFHAEQDLILSQIIKVIDERVSNTDRKQKVSFSGHSLGGGDAQNCAAAFQEKVIRILLHKRYEEKTMLGKATDKFTEAVTGRPTGSIACSSYAPLIMVEEIRINLVNSAGVPHSSYKRSTEHAKRLAKCGVKIKVRSLMVGGDGIQQSGQSNILYDADPSVADVQVFKVASGHEGWLGMKMLTTAAAAATYASAPVAVAGALTTVSLYGTVNAHTKHNFIRPLKPGEYEHHTNATPEGRAKVTSRLGRKTIFDNNPVSHLLKKAANTITSPFVRSRKVSPEVLTRFEMFKTDDYIYNKELFDALCKDEENQNSAGSAVRLVLKS